MSLLQIDFLGREKCCDHLFGLLQHGEDDQYIGNNVFRDLVRIHSSLCMDLVPG